MNEEQQISEGIDAPSDTVAQAEVANPPDSQPQSIEHYYQLMHSRCGEILNESFAFDTSGLQRVSHNFIPDLEKWIALLSSRPEVDLLRAALREYQFALLALLLGQYRQAFMALRLFLELALGSVFLSANELQLRVWLRGRRDINWRPLVSPDDGVLSKFFVDAFFDTLGDDAANYRAIAERVYRECSEYVHGNAATHSALPEDLRFVSTVFSDWHEKAASIRLVISFALVARYLKTLNQDERNSLEAIVLDQLRHVTVIREVFEQE